MSFRNSSRVRPACSNIARRVPRGMSFPCGTMTRWVFPSGSDLTNARWLPLPRSGASINPALRRARMILLEERDGSRTRRPKCQGGLCIGFQRIEKAPNRQRAGASWRWPYRAQRLLPKLPLLSRVSLHKKRLQARDTWKRISCLLSKSQRLDGNASSVFHASISSISDRAAIRNVRVLDNARKGSGLGLSIVKGWVQAHGGRVWAESPGHGKGASIGFALLTT